MGSLGRMMIVFGALLIIVGALLSVGGRLSWFGRLPGDIYIQKKNFTFFFPITTSIIISLLISLFLMLFRRR